MQWLKSPDGSHVVGYDNLPQDLAGWTLCTELEAMQIARISVLTLSEAQQIQTLALRAACQASITAGFISNALGTTFNYPSDPDSQSNQRGAAIAGASLWCEQNAVWGLHQHTATQAAQVVCDFMVWVNKCQTQLAALVSQVNAATDAATVQGIRWVNPA